MMEMAAGLLTYTAPDAGSPSTSTTTIAGSTSSSTIDAVTPDSSTVLAGGGYRYVFVSGSDPKTPDTDFLLPVLTDLAKRGPAPVVLASAATGSDPEIDRTDVVGPVRYDPTLRPGLAFMNLHFPDLVATNVLTIDATDPKSGTAEFKATAIRIEKLAEPVGA